MKKILSVVTLIVSFNSHAALELTNCIIVEPAPTSNVTGIYFDIRFDVTEDVKKLRLPGQESIQGATVKGLSETAEIHETVMVDGVMKMKQLTQFKIKPNTNYHFRRGGHHLMIRDFDKRPVAGEEYELSIWSTYTEEPTCMAKVMKSSDIPVSAHNH
ncbi:copper chaperone PCu(A)C [Vibrio vulnificus]|uniref:copper chaperone PCu(A)C n=1 Tax=Vibrio vulnificus TaxID=672 RepID=UPI00102387BB|nr:copper chaperone PCu(A)C [Vibrio vulnificus]EGR0753415.1 copper chaperone PCu(A)C [Vibrio vulnificus]ELM0341247.1 copper chaperone PCu(A)C [Vibrio vulnificus]RZP94890.1 copper chaperone PCu(A)C [Vibrio vulnificus]RZQ20046.1 copper chaperone PCu(A)C [Vibrio vulnificus]RZQ25249.1 copper chaperone PCu(A)C [Vibrio vulnificus]